MKYVYAFFLILIVASCRKGTEMKTDSGFKYVLYSESKGKKPAIGDYVTLELSYRNENDSVFFDWRKSGTPIRFKLEKIPFKGSYEEGLTYLSENDSATFYVPADSLYIKYYSGSNVSQETSGFLPGTMMKFEVKLLKVQTPAQAEEEMIIKQIEQERYEREDIEKYVKDHDLRSSVDSSGYYRIINQKGDGMTIDTGKVVTLEYTGKFLDGTVFDDTRREGRAYQFIFGAHRVIRGWELALKGLQKGDKITLLVPSRLAYGEEGIRDATSPEFIVPPNKPLIFEMEIVDVTEVPAVTGN